MTKKENEIFDFGFTTYSDEEYAQDEKKSLAECSRDIVKLENIVMPLLKNLAKDGNIKPTIHWPNREDAVNEVIQKIEKITKRYK